MTASEMTGYNSGSPYSQENLLLQAIQGLGKQIETVFTRSAGGLETIPGQPSSVTPEVGKTGGEEAKVSGEVTVKFDSAMFQTAVVDIVGRFIRSGEIRSSLVQQGFTNTGVIP
jgi:hypothetical protein